MKKLNKALFLLPLVTLISCGASFDYLVKGNKYVSSVFTENYYNHWDSELKNASKVEEKFVDDIAITKFTDLDRIDPNVESGVVRYTDPDDYGRDYKMTNLDDSFNYGYQSKLFDGQMVCGAQNYHPEYAYQYGRVQTNEKGFSVRFAKESDYLHYFALQFKASTNNQIDCYPVGEDEQISYASDANHDNLIMHASTVVLTVTIYVKSGSKIIGHPYTSTITFPDRLTNNGHHYVFFAFSLEDEELTRAVGVSFTFTQEDELIAHNKEKGIDIDYALFLYEMFLPYTYWH